MSEPKRWLLRVDGWNHEGIIVSQLSQRRALFRFDSNGAELIVPVAMLRPAPRSDASRPLADLLDLPAEPPRAIVADPNNPDPQGGNE